MMDKVGGSNTIMQLVSLLITTVSTSGAIAAYSNRKSKQERQAGVRHTEAEYENISAQAAATALSALRKELDAANSDLDRRRNTIQGQETRIERQQDQIRRMRRYVEACQLQGRVLEGWVRQVMPMLREASIAAPSLPRVQWPPLPLEDHEYDFDYDMRSEDDPPAEATGRDPLL